MEASTDLDQFISARQLFYLGNYRGVIAEVEHIEISDSKDEPIERCFIDEKFDRNGSFQRGA